MNRPIPEAAPFRNVTFPSIATARSGQGFSIECLHRSHLPKTSLLIGLPVGKGHDPEHLLGLTQATAELLKEGTGSRTSRQIAESFDRSAIEFSAEVAMEHTILSLTLLDRYLDEGVDLLADLLLRPSFPRLELDKLRIRWKSALLAQRSDPAFLAVEQLYRALFPGHPYCRTGPAPDHLDRLTRENVTECHAGGFARDSAVLLFAGSATPSRAGALTDRFFAGWHLAPEPLPAIPPPIPTTESRRVLVVDRPDSTQARILVGFNGLPRTHPDFVRFKLANQVLGGSASARLFLRLREELGLTYGVYSTLQACRHGGILAVGCNTRHDQASTSVREILSAVDRLRGDLPGSKELERSKAELYGEFLRRLETSASVGLMALYRHLIGLPDDYYQKLVPAIAGVEPHDVRQTAEQVLRPGADVIVGVGKGEELRGQFDGFGEVRVVDTEGCERDASS